jgi:quercetin dioxygenase-like cupin family protein
MKITRIYTGDDGESHFEDVQIPLESYGPGGLLSEPVSVTEVIFRETGADYNLDFHPAPRRQYVVNLKGSVELETGSGETRVLEAGEILLAEDTTGRGHRSRAVDEQPRQCLFIPLADE